MRRPEPLDKSCAIYSSAYQVKHYFQLLKKAMNEGNFHQQHQSIYNYDKSIIELNRIMQRIIIPKPIRLLQIYNVASSGHLTIHCCINAIGNTLPPFIINQEEITPRRDQKMHCVYLIVIS